MPREFPQRPTRRHVRFRCSMTSGGRTLSGFSSNVSVDGLYVRVARSQPGAAELKTGAEVKLSFKLQPDEDAVEGSGKIVWVDPDDYDAGGRAVIGIGVRMLNQPTGAFNRLSSFVRDFRYAVMVADGDPANQAQLEQALNQDYDVVTCDSAEQALDVLESREVAVLICSEQMQATSGFDFLKNVSERLPYSHVIRIVLSDLPELNRVQDFINLGKVFHYIKKPFSLDDVRHVVRRAIDAYALEVDNERLQIELERANERLKRENAYLRQRLVGFEGFENIIGKSPQLQRALEDLRRILNSEATVHIQGETGTGKELVARAVHFNGPRKKGTFVAQNCAGFTESLLQSTLFGHRRGAFTGADRDRPGVFQAAHGGTLFLDEVAELSHPVQASLLRALQEGEVVAVGDTQPQKVDVRIVSATHKDLREEVKAGRFREDLYFRLVVLSVRLPPLRERQGDPALLARHFLDLQCERYAKDVPGFSDEAMQLLERYEWPGNIRELENEIERAVLLCDRGQKIGAEVLSPHIRAGSPAAAHQLHAGDEGIFIPKGLSYDEAILRLERSMIEQALEASGGVVARAAIQLGVERSRLAKLRRRLRVTTPAD